MSRTPVTLIPVDGVPAVAPGDDLARLLGDAIVGAGEQLLDGDVLVVCQKVVSKAEGRMATLGEVVPGERARRFADEYDKDPAIVELALSEASEILRMDDGHLITATGPGWVCANSGLDRSNQNADDEVTLLPLDSDASAAGLRAALGARFGATIAVVVSDTFGRPWRLGQIDFAIGAAGLGVLEDHSGRADWSGRPLEHTQIAVADQLAAAAGMLAGKADGVPAVVVRGFAFEQPGTGYACAADLIRPREDDLFR